MRTFLMLALVGCTASLALADKKAAKPAAETKKNPEADMMAMMAKLAAPGPEHAKLKAVVGSWDATSKMWMKPGAPPVETKAVAVFKMTLGDRYLEETYTGSFQGQPFEGRGLTAYDNATKQYLWTWVDTMTTGVFVAKGSADPTGKVTTTAEEFDPMMGKTKTVRAVLTPNSDKQRTLEMFSVGPDGKEMKTMEVVYTRRQ